MNNVNIIGRIASDILKFHIDQFNKDVIRFALAFDNKTRKTDGRKDTFFIECEAWDVVAQRMYENCDKGSKVGITGHLEQAKYKKKDGSNASFIKIVVSGIEFLSESKKQPEEPKEPVQKPVFEQNEEELAYDEFENNSLPI